MLEWLSPKEIWIVIASIAVLILFFFSFRQQIRRSPVRTTAKFGALNKVFNLALWTTGGLVLVVLVVTLLSDILPQSGANIAQLAKTIQIWLLEQGLPILAIIVVAYLIYRFLKVVTPGVIEGPFVARTEVGKEELAKRAETLSSIVISVSGIVIAVVAILMVLSKLGWDITPLLAGAGVATIAIGFGAQSLVRDLLNGLFIILENQYRKGDVVRIAGLSGLVEDVNFRRTVLRDRDGIVHIIPNGMVNTASNFTKEWSRVNLNVCIDYSEDLERVMAVINKVGQELAQDPIFSTMIIRAPKALWVDDFTASGVEIKILAETKPLKQWDVAGELRKRLKIAFDKEGIKLRA